MIRKYHNHKPQTTPWHREEFFNEYVDFFFATVHSLMNDINLIELPNSLARAIRFEHRIHSPEVTLVL